MLRIYIDTDRQIYIQSHSIVIFVGMKGTFPAGNTNDAGSLDAREAVIMQQEDTLIDLRHRRGSTMKITVRNLGAIHETAEIDLKPLTILIGPNNAGKTWLAYTLASVFGEYGYKQYTKPDKLDKIVKEYPPLTEAVDQILVSGIATMNLLQFAKDYGEIYLNNLTVDARDWLAEFMGTKLASFEHLELSIDLREDREPFLKKVLSSQLQIDIGLGKRSSTDPGKNHPLLSFSKEGGKEQLHLYTSSEEPLGEELPRKIIERLLVRNILRIIHQSIYPNVEILPTERTNDLPFNNATVVSSDMPERKAIKEDHEQIFQEFMQLFLQTLKKRSRPLSGPISSYFSSAHATHGLGPQEKREREKLANSIPKVKEYIRLAHVLEETILGGTVDFLSSASETEQPREIIFQPLKIDHPLELSISSSMVKELSPLVFHLRNFAMPGELLIIDEPEMNLHPYAQVQIIEFLVMLVNAGLRVLVTTHSPYMIDHLTNLTLAAAKEDKEAIRSEFFLENTEAFIAKNEVSVYLIDHGEITDVMNDEEQDWDTFGEVSNRISNIYFKL